MKKYKDWSFKAKFMVWFWSLFIGGCLFLYLLFVSIDKGWIGYLPPLEELQNPKNKFATEVFSADMVSLGRYYRKENRVGVQYTDLSPYLVDALISTEDARFYEHTGVDSKSLFRAILLLGKSGGGSTLTQQLAKQLWSPRANNIFERAMQKPIEWVIATKLERLYSKDEILLMYLNQFDFLYNAVGIKSAAQVYFSTTPKDLRIDVYHSGGHGGQSVNTTNSAVRITHIPTNTVVAIQNERSQLQNKEKAMEILRGKLQQMMQDQNAESVDKLRAGESASWGQQIRNYVLHPYKLVKDTRTKYEENDADAVLDGKIDNFIEAFLDN